MHPEVAQAMAEASQWCVDLGELQGRACELIAEATGAEAGYVTAGAAAGLMLGTAACLTGLDPARMNRLPDTTGMPNEVVVARSQRNMYDHAVAQAGAKLIEVGIPDRFSGAGVRDAQVWEYEAAISEWTAAILYVAQGHSEPPLGEIVQMAHRRSIPVIVDAAAQLPPAGNLKRFISEGADLVAFSGGKALGGPQASGILAGRRDLIQSAALQQLDHDTYFEQWSPPASLFDKSKLVGFPASGIGRVAKCGKEEVVGLLTALRLFLEQDHEEAHQRWLASCGEIAAGLVGLAGTIASVIERQQQGHPGGPPQDGTGEARLHRSRFDQAPSGWQSVRPRQSWPSARWTGGVRPHLPQAWRRCHRDRTRALRARRPILMSGFSFTIDTSR